MARITAAEMERKKQKYDDLILHLFLTEGWDAITYDRISKEMGVTKSSIQRYYPHKMRFATALQGKIFPEVIKLLNFSSKDEFIRSWEISLKDNQVFRESIRIIMTNAVAPVTAEGTQRALERLTKLLIQNIGEVEAKQTVEEVLGRTLVLYINNTI